LGDGVIKIKKKSFALRTINGKEDPFLCLGDGVIKSLSPCGLKFVKKIPFMLGGWGNKKSFALRTINL